jgi:hypothetical protein
VLRKKVMRVSRCRSSPRESRVFSEEQGLKEGTTKVPDREETDGKESDEEIEVEHSPETLTEVKK